MIRLEAVPKSLVDWQLPLFASKVACGFPSPAEDYMDRPLDLNEYLIKHKAATYFCRVSGHSMEGQGIHDGDLLIVDRALEPRHGRVVVAAIAGEFTCKILDLHNHQLVAAHPDYKPIPIQEALDVIIEGVVTHSIRAHVCSS